MELSNDPVELVRARMACQGLKTVSVTFRRIVTQLTKEDVR